MERKPVYTIFPAPPSSPKPHEKNRQSADSRARPSFDKPPHPPPSTPLPPIPTSHQPSQHLPTSPQQALPPTPDSLRSVRHASRRKASPNREFADFQRELAQSSPLTASPRRRRPSSPQHLPSNLPPSRQSSHKPPSRQSNKPPSRQSHRASDHSEDQPDSAMQRSMFSTSSTSSLSLAKPPVFPLSMSTISSNAHSQPRGHPRPNTVYFHGGIGGAGNYRKVIRENKRAPRAYAENAEPVRRSSPTRFLSSLFGSQRANARSPAGHGAGRGGSFDEGASGSEESVREEVNLGAAEVLKRKMVGGGWRKKGAP